MHQAGDLLDLAAVIKFLKAGIAVDMEPTFEFLEMISRPPALAIRREPVECCWRCMSRPIPLVPEVHPQPSGLGFAGSRSQHIDRRIIGVDRPVTTAVFKYE